VCCVIHKGRGRPWSYLAVLRIKAWSSLLASESRSRLKKAVKRGRENVGRGTKSVRSAHPQLALPSGDAREKDGAIFWAEVEIDGEEKGKARGRHFTWPKQVKSQTGTFSGLDGGTRFAKHRDRMLSIRGEIAAKIRTKGRRRKRGAEELANEISQSRKEAKTRQDENPPLKFAKGGSVEVAGAQMRGAVGRNLWCDIGLPFKEMQKLVAGWKKR